VAWVQKRGVGTCYGEATGPRVVSCDPGVRPAAREKRRGREGYASRVSARWDRGA
jgi:hypothetical protein